MFGQHSQKYGLIFVSVWNKELDSLTLLGLLQLTIVYYNIIVLTFIHYLHVSGVYPQYGCPLINTENKKIIINKPFINTYTVHSF